MTFPRILGGLAAMLLGAVLLIWIFVSLAALVYALTQGDGQAARIYALFVVVGVAIPALAWWVARRVVKARAVRQ
ncbi:hypothetical protein ACOCJ7_16255 [Knoellia sp. CPCC 206453]|uniref:hypothetical protein n=1 Tax=Knoellia pratensis TaxID=3404796 RepID=UPI003615A175